MEKYNKLLGKFGEDSAEKFLKKKHYKIIERNYKCRFGEIDIVAFDENCLVFIEVKTRSSLKHGYPLDAVNYIKFRHIKLTALNYINYKRLGDYPARFDVVEVIVKNDKDKFEVRSINLIKHLYDY